MDWYGYLELNYERYSVISFFHSTAIEQTTLGSLMHRAMSLFLAVVASSAVIGCGGGSGGSAPAASAPAPIASAAPAPTSSPTTAPPVDPVTGTEGLGTSVVGADLSEGFPQDTVVKDGLVVKDWLGAAWGSGAIPPSNAPDVVGAFRLICAPSHLSYNDPLVNPGQPGKSHLHQFFGNDKADAFSTYKSLRTSGNSTCGDMMNRSAYWMPAMLNARGQVVQPDYATVYYKRRPDSDPDCRMGKGCIGLPRGLRYIFGRTHTGGAYANGRTDGIHFTCETKGGSYTSFSEAAAICPTPDRLGVQIAAPECWNGRELDSPDHRSHMSYTIYDNGKEMCPATHPYRTPTFNFVVWYTTDDTLDRSGNTGYNPKQWYFDSDRMPGAPPMASGSTVHADWFGAWNDDVLSRWLNGCVNRFLNCSGGDLGDGLQLKGASQPSYGWTNPNRLVPIPPRPS